MMMMLMIMMIMMMMMYARYAVLDRTLPPEETQFEEQDDSVLVNGITFNKPFVEKPVDAEDHNIIIYYPASAGGGSQRLFR